jgi:hypothetical protein
MGKAFACLDPDSQTRSGSTDPIESRPNSDPKQWKQLTVNFMVVFWIVQHLHNQCLRMRIWIL